MTNIHQRWFVRIGLIGALLLTGCARQTLSGQPPIDTVAVDPPDRVARVSYLNGTVSFKAAGSDEWVAADVNRPLTAGDELWIADNSRAELDLGHAFIRLDGGTGAGILNLDNRLVQIKLSAGTAQVKLRRLDENDEFEVDTPQAAFTLLRTGEYRFDIAANGAGSKAIARSGQIDAAVGAQTFSIRANQQADVTDAADAANYNLSAAPPLDAFDTFCQTRDRRLDGTEADAYVSPYVIGRDDLNEFGTWRTYSAYGPVWVPRTVRAGWAPYRFGHWVWIAPWGWTWVDDEPWGFAPFHYGRWVVIDTVWVWVPGPVRIRAVYAPALVVFVGGGPGLRYHVRVGAGLGVAWFPLGPREIYVPPYRSSRIYVTNINISHTTVVNTTNIWRTDVTNQRYVNRSVVTAVAEDVFVRARPVGPAVANIGEREARAMRIEGTAAPVAPSRESLARRGEDARPAPRPPAATEQRRVTVRRAPAPPAVPLEQQRPALDRDPGRPANPTEEQRRQQPQPEYRRTRPAEPAPAPAPASPPARSRREPPADPAARQPSPRQTEDRRRQIDQEHRTDSQRTSKQSQDRGRRK